MFGISNDHSSLKNDRKRVKCSATWIMFRWKGWETVTAILCCNSNLPGSESVSSWSMFSGQVFMYVRKECTNRLLHIE